jgi:para-aminobenzoate synthetase component 1
LICASPERFLKKVGNKLISQPIKGTIKRGANEQEDLQQIALLRNSEKERAENMMIVDLVRNDLARSCKAGTVKVEEMFGIYPFKHLFQMISTVSGELKDSVHFIDSIKNAFPMGSMTGAPKIKAMELIEKYEQAKRGLFSSAVGFITPAGDFDFNVVIRSIFYDGTDKRLSFQAGSAITYDSDPHEEYEECMLKVKAILNAINY